MKNKDRIGYSGFIIFDECYEYNENACFIADTPELTKEFMKDCGYSISDYRIDEVTFSDILDDYGCSAGEYAMEPIAFSKFKEIADKEGIKYEATKFDLDPTLTVVNVLWNKNRAPIKAGTEEVKMDFKNDKNMDILQNIEFGLKVQYEKLPQLTDTQCIFALENAKIAIKKEFGYAKNERVTNMEEAQGIIQWCVEIGLERINKVNNLTLKEYISRIEKIRKSVNRHSKYGNRGYYEFIKSFV